jgi:crotonobetainyl-CoA:carnitine CoA-transferase CaiB-like acyl-CoA transferase
MTQTRPGPLHGVRVLDLTGVVMGPWATQALGDMGADVIKIEPTDGDVMRFLSPSRHDSMSPAFLNFNRNKRSVALDLKSARGKERLLKIAGLSDVFVSNVRPQAMRRLGLDYEALQQKNPRIIYCGCYGYGEDGPYAGRAAVDDTIQAASGLAWLQGYRGDEPRYANAVIADKVVGLYAAQAIAMALYAREKTGRGQFIEVPMFETMAAFVVPEHLAGLTFEPPLGPAGYERLLNPYRKPFKTLDGHIAVVPYNDHQWTRFFKIAGRDELISDPRYATVLARSRHFSELYRLIEETLATRTTAEWGEAFERAELPFALVNSFDALLEDPHLAATGFWHEVEHPTEGRVRQAAIPVKLSDTPASIRRPAPNLGEHTEEVLRELGIE